MPGRLQGVGPSTCIVAQEGPFGGSRDPLPDTDGLGVAGVSTLRLLIEAPVPGTKSTRLWVLSGWGGLDWSLLPLGKGGLTCPPGRRRCDLWVPTRWPCRCGHRGCPGHSWSVAEGSRAPGLLLGRASSGHLREGEVDEDRRGLGAMPGEGIWGVLFWAHKSIHIHSHTHRTHTTHACTHIHHTIIHTLLHRIGTDPYTHPR